MKYTIVGKNIEVTDAIKSVVETELDVLNKYFENKETEVNVQVRTYKVGQKVQILIKMDKDHILRQEEVADDLYDAIRLAAKKMERQVRKFKSRISDYSHKKGIMALFTTGDYSEETSKITKRKVFEDKLMTEEEAVLQFELIGHDFYIFTDANTQTQKVLYKRKEDGYGIIELEK